MALLRPYKQDAEEPTPAPAKKQVPHPTGAKNHPTPTRKQAEAARMAAVHPKLTRRQARAADQEVERKRQAERMEAVENAPERVLMRNYVDSRWSILELMMGLLVLLLAAMLFGSYFPTVLAAVTALLYVFLVAGLINFFIAWQRFKKELYARYPNASTKGLAFAMLSRMMAFRRMRQPKCVIKRGESY